MTGSTNIPFHHLHLPSIQLEDVVLKHDYTFIIDCYGQATYHTGFLTKMEGSNELDVVVTQEGQPAGMYRLSERPRYIIRYRL